MVLLFAFVVCSFGQSTVSSPVVISNPDPLYPAEAGTLGYGGNVIVHIEVNKKGKVSVKRAFGPAAPCSNLVDSRVDKIRKAVVDAAKQAQFEPTLQDGKPVDIEMKLTYRFDESGKPAKSEKPGTKVVEAGVLQGRVKRLA